MSTRKVSKQVPKIETSEMPVAQTEVATEVATAPGKRASKVAKPVAGVVKLAPKPRASRAAKPVLDPAATPEAGEAAEPTIVVEQAKPAKPAKIRRAKLVRDSYTMPEAEHAAIAGLKKRCLGLGVAARKSEVLRAALTVLARLSDAELMATIQGLAVIKTGRPAKGVK